MTRTRIAVVDDDASVRNALCRLLRASDLDAQSYSNGTDFLAALRTFQPHCAIVDLHMPDLSGLETQKQLLIRGAKIPVIIVTGHDEPLSKSECLTAGVWAYLVKPVDENTLLTLIDDITKNRCRSRAQNGLA